MLQHIEKWTTAAEVYDGDVVTHPVSGETVTILTMMQLSALQMHFVPGVVEFDPFDNVSSYSIDTDHVGELELEPDAAIYLQRRYTRNRPA